MGSKWLRLGLSAVLFYFAFRKIDIRDLVVEMTRVPWWFVVGMMVYYGLTSAIGTARWVTLMVDKPSRNDFWNFLKAGYVGGFYSLVFPSAVGGDLVKWLPLVKKYPELTKTQIASSVLIDRIVGLSAFSIVAMVALLVGRYLGYQFPTYLLWLFALINIGMIGFYLTVWWFDFEKYFGRYKFLSKIIEIVDIFRSGKKKRLITAFIISMVGEPVWLLPVWFYSLIFGAGVKLLDVFIFMPVINLILVLPISVAGFGAREQLFLYFFRQLAISDNKILLLSTFGGVIGLLYSLFGGIFILF